MTEDERENALELLFGLTTSKLDELNSKGINIPSDVYLQLGRLQGNMAGIMRSIALNHEKVVADLEEQIEEYETDTPLDIETDEEEFTRMEQVSTKHQTKVDEPDDDDDAVDREPGEERSPMARRRSNRNIVNLRDE